MQEGLSKNLSERLSPEVRAEVGPEIVKEVAPDDLDLTTEVDCVTYMEASTSNSDFDARYDQIVKANGGRQPSFWQRQIQGKMLYQRISSKWSKE